MLFLIGVVYWKEVSVCNLKEQEDPRAFSYTHTVSSEGTVFNILC